MKTVRRVIRALPLLLLTATLLVAAGCVSVPVHDQVLTVDVVEPDWFIVDGREGDAAALPKLARQAGAVRETEIRLRLPAGVPPGQMARAMASLNGAGYRRVLLVHPRQATAEVGAPGSTPPPPPARAPTRSSPRPR